MSDRKLGQDEVERLLRQTLTDDPPPEVEERLGAGLRPAWRRAAVSEASGRDRKGRRGLGLAGAWGALLPSRAVLAAASVLLLAGGVVTHLLNPPRALAESLSLRQAATATAWQLARAAAMDCAVETREADGRTLRYRIEWQASRGTRVWIADADGVSLASVEQPVAESLLDFTPARTALRRTSQRPGDPRLPAVGDILSPETLSALLAGAWEALPRPALPGVARFDISTPGRARLEVTIDQGTRLPLQIEVPSGLSARCAWVPGEPGRLLLGGVGGPGRR